MMDPKKKLQTNHISKAPAARRKERITTYLMVIGVFIFMQRLDMTGNLSNQLRGLLVPLCYFSIAAVALNLTVGILGELSLGHAGFMCVGAFTSAVFSVMTADALPGAVRFILALLIGVLCAAVAGFLIGIPVLRLKGDYLAIVTLAFGEIIKNILNSLYLGSDGSGLHASLAKAPEMDAEGKLISNGAMGITGIPHDANFILGIVLLLVTLYIVQNLVDSRGGRAIMAIRDNRIAAETLGINITRYKMTAFTVSAAIAGAAGVLFAHNIGSFQITGTYFGYNASIMLLVYVVLGGIGNIRGSVIAAVILYLIPELFRGLGQYRMLIYAVVLIVMMIVNWNPKSKAFISSLSIKDLLFGRKGKKKEEKA